ncbi:hypothetical protein MVES1_003448 [Malassezia vespertilionis]|uniref:Tr-type G domain-containing protein n=1 Tax=Malassezia vespertilionis TaxID=2020962 RepID=A0A2N1J7H8_9BASI|nr:uncharacterized protein MVES1_003448 [Malassezia vespertilionis]PKI82501.1 hypothetical protein MVES_003686 [Malassezia vespertilionis]WFD08079.1 hypothetical protein MVES1_003448 [Malassezia vespertilionis]
MDDYDEFGNYIGPLSDSASEAGDVEEVLEAVSSPSPDTPPPEGQLMQLDDDAANAVVLHEDKVYYPSAHEVYGEDVETIVQEEDTQPLTQPIIEPEKVRAFAVEEEGLPAVRYDRTFMLDLMQFPEMVRNVAVVGHLAHGKTGLLDMLVEQTHHMLVDADKPQRYTDTHVLERERGMTIRCGPLSMVLQDTCGKSYTINLIDTPGHPNFQDEVAAALHLVDGVVLVVDVAEGVMCTTESLIRFCVREKIPMTLVLNKLDRLILELRLPPQEAYFKIRHTIEAVNSTVGKYDQNPALRFDPGRGNVAFASTQTGWVFTLRSFAQMYAQSASLDSDAFAARLWGNIYYHAETRTFSRKAPSPDAPRSFVQFILAPLYKLYAHVLSSETASLKALLKHLRIFLPPAAYKSDVRPLLRMVMHQFFGDATGLVDLFVSLPSALAGAARLAAKAVPSPSRAYTAAAACDAQGPLVVQVTKLFPTKDAAAFRAYGRVFSGTISSGDAVKVLGATFTQDDEEDMVLEHVDDLWIAHSRYVIPAQRIPAGNLVLLGGVSASIVKGATICAQTLPSSDTYLLRPPVQLTESVLKVAVEPLNPSELPRMLDGLRKVNKAYPLLETRVEESGEHTMLGTGELYLDTVMHDLRVLYSEIEIKISDPVVKLCETAVETSAVQCYAVTPNKRNKLTVIAEPLESGIAEDIERHAIDVHLPLRQLAKVFQERYGWDALAARNIWAFGPDVHGPNIFIDDTLPDEVDKKQLYLVREYIKQGFQWATREGPLCDEPIRGIKFRLVHAEIAQEPIHRGGGQLIPTARRACYAAALLATPRLMEPIFSAEIQAPPEAVSAVYTLLARRRGHVVQDVPEAGTPLVTVKALLPAMDANGFETDLRVLTQGQAFALQMFDHWSVVPGDPLDTSIALRPLEPAPALGLARDFVLKMRRRKGLSDTIAVSSYLEHEMTVALAQAGLDIVL